MEFLTANDVTLQVNQSGLKSGPALVFVNSLGTDLRIWDRILSRLNDRFLIIRYDKRGHGLSDCPPGPYSIQDHMHDLQALLDGLEIEQVHIVGISVGGMIALALAAALPNRVRSLVLMDTAPKIGTADMWNERIETLRRDGMAVMTEAILARWFAPAFRVHEPAAYRGYANMLNRMPLEGYIGTCAAIRDADLTEAAKMVQAPTLVLCGAEDQATPPELVGCLTDLIAGAGWEVIAEAGHLPCVEQPAVVANSLLRFYDNMPQGN